MFEREQQSIADQIRQYCAVQDIPQPELKWMPIPFRGEWGMSTSFFASAAAEAKAGKLKGQPVPARAQSIAEAVQAAIGAPPGIQRSEAVNGYLNLYFSTPVYARRVVDTVLAQGRRFG